MSKPVPYSEWFLFPASEGESKNPPPNDDELILAAREVWPRVIAHAKKELRANGLTADSDSMAAQVWERMLRSVSRTRQRNSDRPQAIADLQSCLFLAFVHRFNRGHSKNRNMPSGLSLFRPVLTLNLSKVPKMLGGSKNWNDQLQSEKLKLRYLGATFRYRAPRAEWRNFWAAQGLG